MSTAAERVALNLAEGRDRREGDKRRHYEMAKGSAGELTAALRIALIKRIITRDELAAIDALLDRVLAMVYRLATR
jgi:four helix bundle protein